MTRYSMRDYSPSTSVLLKARRYLARGAVRADDALGVFWVQGSERKPYHVQGDFKKRAGKTTCSWITCTCEWGRQQGAGASACSHAVAALLAVKKGVELPRVGQEAAGRQDGPLVDEAAS